MPPELRRQYTVDILVRGYGNAGLTDKLLASIIGNTQGVDYQITYVDNGSTIAEYGQLVRAFPQIQHVRLPWNHGSVRAINVGLALAFMSPSEYVLLLDNDTEIPEGDSAWLTRFIAHLKDGTVAAAGAVSSVAATVQDCERTPPTYTRAWQDDKGRAGYAGHIESPVLASFALLMRKGNVKEVGLWDERYEPGNFEDYDYCLRLREAGFKTVIAQDVWVHHRGHSTFRADLNELVARNQQKFVAKWGADKLKHYGLMADASAEGK